MRVKSGFGDGYSSIPEAVLQCNTLLVGYMQNLLLKYFPRLQGSLNIP